ncbi:MAG TPA: PD-(D/E)XK nuclease family protein, partial [Usitatibacter sp.]|nr:PD-(D/E)XK nuclease family protein [Usitatibacter sp.]
AARWARSRLAGGSARIGIVVPDLSASRAKVQRLLARVLQPGHALGEDGALPFDLSLGAALADFPLVADALRILELGGPVCAFEDASRVIRSAFVAGAESEMAVRARLDAKLRKRCAPSLRLDTLQRLASSERYPQAPVFLAHLERLAKVRKANTGAKSAADWAHVFSDALRAMGFPGERTLDSNEYQALEKWHDLLAQFANLEAVTPVMDYPRARERLERMARDTIFQPQARDVPIQVLGVLESAGLEFDHLWVMGLTDEAWPLPARPNPFLPARLQRAAGVPQADPVTSLELDQRITEGWMRAAPEVVFSHARLKGESELAPSPLIKALPVIALAELRVGEFPLLRDAIRAQGAIETLEDAKAPAIVDTGGAPRRGGTSLFRDQAVCPFKAYAKHRLASDSLETPRPGLSLRDRGSLVHCMLGAVWKSLETSERLASTSSADLDKLLHASADEAIAQVKKDHYDALAGRFGELEHARLVRIAREWLEAERAREDFQVVEMEQKHPLSFGGVTVNVKLDRMDRLAHGGHAVIDYKTGACAPSSWLGPRPEEPQLPMYALSAKDVVAVAFGQVKTGEMGFKGVSKDPGTLPRVDVITKNRSPAAKEYRDWNSLLQGWRAELEAAGRGFASGDARVDPKRGELTCSICEQKMLCRIAEKAPFGAVGAGESDE